MEIGYNLATGELDPGAIPSFNTGSSGEAYFGTDAYDGTWSFFAKDGPNDVQQSQICTASITIPVPSEVNGQVLLVCGSDDAEMVATPSSCEYNSTVTPVIDTCPATITLTFPPAIASSHLLPLNAALTAADYNGSGTNLAQSSVTAATTASVVVPTPTAVGASYIGVYNAAGNLVGISEFTYTLIHPPPNPCPQVAVAAIRSGPSPDSVFCPPK